MASRIAINTVQGIGDIFWVYQKLAPYFDEIDLNILCVDLGPIQKRAEPFCRMLPKVRAVTYQQVTSGMYHRVAAGRFPIADVLRAAPGPLDYAVNAPLEQGVNLRAIDPGAELAEFVDLGLPAAVERGDYLCVYVSGTGNPRTTWAAEPWVAAADRLAQRLGTKRIDLVGSAWDTRMQDRICIGLQALGYDVKDHVSALDLAGTLDVIRCARFFLGYQSGLNVLADNYDVSQGMVYFSKLRAMLYTWCKPGNVRTKFNAWCFDDDENSAIDALPLPSR